MLLINTTTAGKIWGLLESAERRRALVLLGMMLIGMVLETLGVGLVIPAIALLTRPDYAERFPALQPILATFSNSSHEALVIGSILGLVGVYLFKALYLAFLAWCQTRFAFGLQAKLSQRLFTLYLRQPYTFHLQRNSAQLFRNASGEVGTFTHNVMIPSILLLTEALVLLGLCTLLLVVEPLGALIVVSTLGIAGGLFHHLTRRRVAHWGAARQHHEGLRIQHLQQGLAGAKDVKLLGRETEDTVTEHGVMEAVRALHGIKTTIIIAHRLSTVEQCDRLYRLERGRVVQEGKTVELLGAKKRALE